MDRRIIPIFFIVFTNILGAGVIIPILPLVAVDSYGASVAQATFLASTFFAAQFVAAPWLGKLSDRIGRRPVLIVSQLGTVLSFVMFSLAGPIGGTLDGLGLSLGITGGMAVLYVARLLDGLTGGNITTARAYITDVSTENDRAQALGMINAAFGLGFIFGPVFGGVLAGISLVAPFIGAAIITSGSVLLTSLMLKESLPDEKRSGDQLTTKEVPLRHILGDSTILLVLTIAFVVTVSYSALQSTFALFAEEILYPDVTGSAQVARNVGFMFTFAGIIIVLTQAFLIKPIVARMGERRAIVLGQASLAIAFAGISFSSSPLVMTLFLAPVAFGNGINQPGLQAVITRFSSERTRGRLLGLYQSANSLALILGPVWAGYVFQAINPRAPFRISVLGLLAGVGPVVVTAGNTQPGGRYGDKVMIARYYWQAPKPVSLLSAEKLRGRTNMSSRLIVLLLTALFVTWAVYRLVGKPLWITRLSPFWWEMLSLLEIAGAFTLLLLWLLLWWRVGRRKPLQTRAFDVAMLYALEPSQFEEFVAGLFRAKGFQVSVVGRSGDQGVDLKLLRPDGKRAIVQCKRYRSKVGPGTARELYGALIHERAAHAFLITTAEISQSTRRWAHGKSMTL
ncbi:MAG: MFS transporter, partial [Thiogranum sp.]